MPGTTSTFRLARFETTACAVLLALLGTGCLYEPSLDPAPGRDDKSSTGTAAAESDSTDGGSDSDSSLADDERDAVVSSGADVAGTRRQYDGISFEIPGNWRELPGQTFVDSKYIIPTDAGEMEITLTSMGGGIEANLERWVGQVQRESGDEPEWSDVDVAGIKSRQVDVRGSFNTTVGDNPGLRENWRLIGIAVPLSRSFFIKLVGPREAIAEYQGTLNTLLSTARCQE